MAKSNEESLTPFLQAANIQQASTHQYTANVHPGWCFGPIAHGGYLSSLAWEAVREHFATTLKRFQQDKTFSIHIEFLQSAAPGRVIVNVKDVRLAKGTSTVGFTLVQGGRERCVGFVSNCSTNPAPAISKTLDLGYTPTPTPPRIDFEAVLAGSDNHWIRYDVHQPPAAGTQVFENLIFAYPRQPLQTPAEKRATHSWISLRDPQQKWTASTLGILLDSAVPPPENFYPSMTFAEYAQQSERSGIKSSWIHPPWREERLYSTLNTTVEVKKQLPEEGEKWLMLTSQTKEVVEGRFDVGAEVWDSKGRLVATASSLWRMFDLSRVGKKSSSGKGKEGVVKRGKL